MHFLVHGLVGGGIQAAAAGHVKSTAAGAVNFMDEINDAGRIIIAGFQQHCTGAVAKNYASGAVGIVNDGRHDIGTDDQHRLMRAGRNELGAGLKCVNKSRAGRRQIKSPSPFCAEFVLHDAGSRGEKHVRGHGGDNDRADLVGS